MYIQSVRSPLLSPRHLSPSTSHPSSPSVSKGTLSYRSSLAGAGGGGGSNGSGNGGGGGGGGGGVLGLLDGGSSSSSSVGIGIGSGGGALDLNGMKDIRRYAMRRDSQNKDDILERDRDTNLDRDIAQ